MVQPKSHTEIRKRNEAFQKRAGKSNPLKPVDALDRQASKPSVSKWAVGALMFVVLGPVIFQLVYQVYLTLSKPVLLR